MKEKIVASLLGVAVGDALGFPFEGLPRETLRGLNLCYFHRGDFLPGTWSDDTSLTFITVESLLACGRFDPEDLASRFWRWLQEGYFTPFGKALGVGRATKTALERYARGVPPLLSGGKGERDCGNGSLMRLLPVILWYRNAPEEILIREVHRASALTHAHPRALLACGLYAFLIKALSKGKTLREAFIYVRERGLSFYGRHLLFSRELSHFEPLWNGSLFSFPEEKLRASGYVVHTLLTSFWILYRTKTFSQAVRLAIHLGEDTDTTAAVVGGAAGFYYGLGEIPFSWVDGLLKKERLFELASTFAVKTTENEG